MYRKPLLKLQPTTLIACAKKISLPLRVEQYIKVSTIVAQHREMHGACSSRSRCDVNIAKVYQNQPGFPTTLHPATWHPTTVEEIHGTLRFGQSVKTASSPNNMQLLLHAIVPSCKPIWFWSSRRLAIDVALCC